MQASMQPQCHAKEISCRHQQPNHSAGQLPKAPSQIGLRQAIRLSNICRAYTAAIDIPTAFTDPALRAAYEAGHKAGFNAASSESNGAADPYNAAYGSFEGLPSEEDLKKQKDAEKAKRARDSIARSAIKGLCWRVFSTLLTVILVLVVLRGSVNLKDALSLGSVEFFSKYVMYIAHEQLWAYFGSSH